MSQCRWSERQQTVCQLGLKLFCLPPRCLLPGAVLQLQPTPSLMNSSKLVASTPTQSPSLMQSSWQHLPGWVSLCEKCRLASQARGRRDGSERLGPLKGKWRRPEEILREWRWTKKKLISSWRKTFLTAGSRLSFYGQNLILKHKTLTPNLLLS